jgi:hypothetical protein
MASIIRNNKGFSSDVNRVDFSLRVNTEQCLFGPNVLVVAKMFSGEVKRAWMGVAEATDFVAHNEALGVSVMSAHIEYRGVFDEWGQSL